MGSVVMYGIPPMCKRVPGGRFHSGIFFGELFMALYFLEYDLVKQKDYQPLYTELARIGAVRHLLSAWSFKHNVSGAGTQLRTHFCVFRSSWTASSALWSTEFDTTVRRRQIACPLAEEQSGQSARLRLSAMSSRSR